ncbi:MAG TPA: hypothetical protein VFX48_07390, partial [Saprospiraceae bacterium]|nr:hypothetical protein [Saprospiraceae bacterium]
IGERSDRVGIEINHRTESSNTASILLILKIPQAGSMQDVGKGKKKSGGYYASGLRLTFGY